MCAPGDQRERRADADRPEVDRLASLVDTLLRLSHTYAGTVALARASVDLRQFVAEVVASPGILAEDRNQRIRIEAPEPIAAIADRVILREALINIVDNAIKYSPPGSSIEMRMGTADGRAVMIVHDEGPGIRPEHRGRIFDRFFRVDEARSRAAVDSGLGLAIAKWAIEVNGFGSTMPESPARRSGLNCRCPRCRMPQDNVQWTRRAATMHPARP